MKPDVLIVGGGPAGAGLASTLASQGARVLLLEAARFPRPKPCGECLNPGAVAAMQRLGLWEAAAELTAAELDGWRLHAGPNHSATAAFPTGRTGRAVCRARLDQALLRHAAARGAAVEEGVRVADLRRSPEGRVTGVTTSAGCRIDSPLVVGADGLRSVVTRRLGLLAQPGWGEPKVAFTAHWTGVSGLTRWGELHFHQSGQAVCGIAPIGGGQANVTLVLPAAAARSLHKGQAGLLLRWPDLRERFAVARPTGRTLATGPFDQPVRAVTAPGALLIGDAAGYYDPLTGQGLYRAFRSAELAAATILTNSPLSHYERALTTELRPATRRQRWIDALVQRPALLGPALTLLERWPGAATWVVGLLGDCHHPEGAILPCRPKT